MSTFKLLINGRLEDGDARMDVINPATEEVLAVAPRASKAQLEKAVAAAKAALDRKSTRLNSSHLKLSRMPSSA